MSLAFMPTPLRLGPHNNASIPHLAPSSLFRQPHPRLPHCHRRQHTSRPPTPPRPTASATPPSLLPLLPLVTNTNLFHPWTTPLFTITSTYVATVTLFLATAPSLPLTRRFARSHLTFLPIALVYSLLLAWSWQPDTFSLVLPGSLEAGLAQGFNPQFIPSLPGIATLFSRVATAASLWVHILAINLFAAKQIYLDGLRLRLGRCVGTAAIPTWHSILMCLVLGPLGLVSHAGTKALYEVLRVFSNGNARSGGGNGMELAFDSPPLLVPSPSMLKMHQSSHMYTSVAAAAAIRREVEEHQEEEGEEVVTVAGAV